MRILFMGTPDFAAVSLKRLVEDGHELCGVFTQPDRPKNRGHKLAFSPVKEYALSQGLTVYQPTKMRDGTALALVRELQRYVQGACLYVPVDRAQRKGWGERSGARAMLDRRNEAIRRAFRQGASLEELGEAYHLSPSAIGKIVYWK